LAGIDLGYGPATYVDPVTTRQLASAWRDVTEQQLALKFDPAALHARGAYPDIWDRTEEMADVRRDVVSLARQVIGLYERAVAAGEGVLIAML
jgi:hypothetical protein